jgi:hypothetical protein
MSTCTDCPDEVFLNVYFEGERHEPLVKWLWNTGRPRDISAVRVRLDNELHRTRKWGETQAGIKFNFSVANVVILRINQAIREASDLFTLSHPFYKAQLLSLSAPQILEP